MLCSALLLAAWACSFPSFTAPPLGAAAGTANANDAGAAGCNSGNCEEPCPVGFADCDQDADNGCETALGTDHDCGGCGIACNNEHGLNHCGASGECEPTCAAGYGDCDLRPETGCETSINEDSLNCGGCGLACPANGGTPSCVAGKCGLSSCNPGFGDCTNAGACSFNLNVDPQNCGSCGHVCSSAHGTPRCNAGVCEADCAATYGDCNGGNNDTPPPNDGCETQLNVPDKNGNVPNCGACGAVCQRRAFTTVNLKKCAEGICFLDCMAGAYDCDNQRNDPTCLHSGCGCEYVACN